MAVHDLTMGARLMLGIAERGRGRSGCSLSWLAVYCQRLISHTAPANALFNIHPGKFDESHVSIWLSANAPNPPFPSSSSSAAPVRSPSPLTAAGGLLGRSASCTSSLLALGLGRGESKPAWLLPIFPVLTSNQPHSRDVSCQASGCPSLPPLLHPLGAQAHRRVA